jgi:DNA-binding response OmpR family regulator
MRPPTKAKRRILVVDDEISLTRMIKLALETTSNYEVRTESVAAKAGAAAREFKPELILLDVMMPGMDGGTLAARLQASPETKAIPIVFLTAAVKKEEVGSHGGMIGGFPYLAKPVSAEELIDCIERTFKEAKI